MRQRSSKDQPTRSKTIGWFHRERRFVTLGLLAGVPVSLVHTETEYEIRIISFRKGTKREAQIYFDAFKD